MQSASQYPHPTSAPIHQLVNQLIGSVALLTAFLIAFAWFPQPAIPQIVDANGDGAGKCARQPCPGGPYNDADGDVDRLIFAIDCANQLPGPDVINLAVGGTYTLLAEEAAGRSPARRGGWFGTAAVRTNAGQRCH